MKKVTHEKTETTKAGGELFTIKRAADELEVHPNTVRGYIRSGQLPAVLLGPRMIRIRRSDIEHLLTPYQAEASVWTRPVR